MDKRGEKGFSLVELLIVVVVIGIIAAAAVIGYRSVITGTKNNLQRQRLVEYAGAQEKFRTALGKRRYGTFAELKAENLLKDSFVRFNADGSQAAIDGWVLDSSANETAAYLKSEFKVVLRKSSLSEHNASLRVNCIHSDGVMRVAASSTPTSCTSTSEVVEP